MTSELSRPTWRVPRALLLRIAMAAASVCVSLGSVAQLTPSTHFRVLHTFGSGADGAFPRSDLIIDAGSNIYGTTFLGGNLAACVPGRGCGTVFEVSKAGKETVLHRFSFGKDGAWPLYGHLTPSPNGSLYGMSYLGGDTGCGGTGCGTIYKVSKSGSETVLYRFGTNKTGNLPLFSNLMLTKHNELYGTTTFGGTDNCGTLFKLENNGQETVLYTFKGSNSGDGCGPTGVVEDATGTMYGTTLWGGRTGTICDTGYKPGCGTLFKIDRTGKEVVLHKFTGTNGDGAFPWASLLPDANGSLYGTTVHGGDLTCTGSMGSGCGVVFKLNSQGNESVLYKFSGRADGGSPYAALHQDAKGNLYGTTLLGGNLNCAKSAGAGCGVVFKLDAARKETVLYSFRGDRDGSWPVGLVLDSGGNLYGTTIYGGNLSCAISGGFGCGVMFKIAP